MVVFRNRRGFTLRELIMVIAITGALLATASFYTYDYVTKARTDGAERKIAKLNQALEEYRVTGGRKYAHSLYGLNTYTKVSRVLNAMKNGFTVDNIKRNFLNTLDGIDVTQLAATGQGNRFIFTSLTGGAPDGGAPIPLGPAPSTASGQMLAQYWDNYPGYPIASFDEISNFADYFTTFEMRSTAQTASNRADYYYAKLSGYIYPPTTANYTFRLSSDDESQLWLSTDSTEANLVKIVEAPSNVSTYSSAIPLQAGSVYFLKAFVRDGSSADNLRVGWSHPASFTQNPIAAAYIGAPLYVGQTANTMSVRQGTSVVLRTPVAGATSYQWYKGASAISGATSSTYSISNFQAANTGTYTLRAYNSTQTKISANINVTMISPSITGTLNRQRWDGISGYLVSDLTSSPNYPNSPTATDTITSANSYNNYADSYGTRIYGYIYPPYTGFFIFSVNADNSGELWLSTDNSPANKVLIASGDYTGTVYSGQIFLESGRNYYIEGLHKEDDNVDRFTIGWRCPALGFPQATISSAYISTTSN